MSNTSDTKLPPKTEVSVPPPSNEAQIKNITIEHETASTLQHPHESKLDLQMLTCESSLIPSRQTFESQNSISTIDSDNEIIIADAAVSSDLSEIVNNKLAISSSTTIHIQPSINGEPIVKNWQFTDDYKRIEFIDGKYVFARGRTSSITWDYKCMSCTNKLIKYNNDSTKYSHLVKVYYFPSPGTLKYKVVSKSLYGFPEKPSGREHICKNQDIIDFYKKLDEYKKEQLSKEGIRTADDKQCDKKQLFMSTYPISIPVELKWLLDKMEITFPTNENYRPHYLYALAKVCDTVEEMIKKTFYFGITDDLQNRLTGHKGLLLSKIKMKENTVMVSLLKGRHNMMKCCDLEALLIGYHSILGLSKLNITYYELQNKKDGNFTTDFEIFEIIMRKKDHDDHERMGIALRQLFHLGMQHGHRVYSSRIGKS